MVSKSADDGTNAGTAKGHKKTPTIGARRLDLEAKTEGAAPTRSLLPVPPTRSDDDDGAALQPAVPKRHSMKKHIHCRHHKHQHHHHHHHHKSHKHNKHAGSDEKNAAVAFPRLAMELPEEMTSNEARIPSTKGIPQKSGMSLASSEEASLRDARLQSQEIENAYEITHISMPSVQPTAAVQSQDTVGPGAFPVSYMDHASIDNQTIVTGSEDYVSNETGATEDYILTAEPVDDSERDHLRIMIQQLQRREQQAQAERDQIVEAEVIRSEGAQPTGNKKQWILGGTLLLLVIIAGVVLGVVFVGSKNTGDESTTDGPQISTPPSAAPPSDTIQPDPDIFEQLVTLFSSKNPDTATALQDTSSAQYLAMQWLAVDMDESSYTLQYDQARIVQRGSLVIFFYSTLGDRVGQWDNTTGWLDHGGSECEWFGVTCSSAMVTQLDFYEVYSGNNLGGTIPRELVFLDGLQHVHLNGNGMGGTIPNELGQLMMLRMFLCHSHAYQIMWLHRGITHTSPFMSSFSEELYLSWNDLTGTLPTEMGLFPNLGTLLVYVKWCLLVKHPLAHVVMH